MIDARRFCLAAMIAALVASPVAAADVASVVAPAPPPAPPSFYVHAGALGVFPETNAQSTGGGYFNTVGPGRGIAQVSNIAIRPNYTVGLEVGYFITSNIAIALSAGVPPLAHLKATGFTGASALGSNLLGSNRYGPAMALLQYHVTQWGSIQPYGGLGVGYLFNFGNISDGILTNFSVDQNFAFILQGGADVMLTPNLGVYVDVKKIFLTTEAQGFASGLIPVRARVQLDPWLIGTGVTAKF
jgi:outer membrane protein